MTSPKLRTSGLGRKSYLSPGKSFAIVRMLRLTLRRLLLMPCAGVGSGRCCAMTAIAVASRSPRRIHAFMRFTPFPDHVSKASLSLWGHVCRSLRLERPQITGSFHRFLTVAAPLGRGPTSRRPFRGLARIPDAVMIYEAAIDKDF